jgi:hypothetical protein
VRGRRTNLRSLTLLKHVSLSLAFSLSRFLLSRFLALSLSLSFSLSLSLSLSLSRSLSLSTFLAFFSHVYAPDDESGTNELKDTVKELENVEKLAA